MKSHEFITDDKRPSPDFINSQVDKQQWEKLGHGADVSVWQHIADPNTVVKIVGGGRAWDSSGGMGVILYAKFCIDNEDTNKHFLRVLDINDDDPKVCQIRVERLLPLPNNAIGDALQSLSEAIDYNLNQNTVREYAEEVELRLTKDGISKNNQVTDIIAAIIEVNNSRYDYAKQFKTNVPLLDLHDANWMMRPNGTIVISDPWS